MRHREKNKEKEREKEKDDESLKKRQVSDKEATSREVEDGTQDDWHESVGDERLKEG